MRKVTDYNVNRSRQRKPSKDSFFLLPKHYNRTSRTYTDGMVIRRFYGHLGEEKNKKIERSWNFQTFLFVDYLLIENKHIVDGGELVAGGWTGEMLDVSQ